MSEQLDPSSVLAYLNEMGYYNISTYQLKEFLKDLRKLMKYEDKFNFQTNINDDYARIVFEKSDQLYSTQTISSKAKTTQKCPDIPKETKDKSTNENKDKLKDNQNVDKMKENNKHFESSEKTILSEAVKSIDSKRSCISNIANTKVFRECQSLPAKSVTSKKSIPRTITSAKSFNTRLETDPVVLYHQYKKEWERKKIPGENNHSRLRWKIRQKICQL